MTEPQEESTGNPGGRWTEAEMIAWVDAQTYDGLLRWWRFAPPGDRFFQGGTGAHYSRIMKERAEQLSCRTGEPRPASGLAGSTRAPWEHPPGSRKSSEDRGTFHGIVVGDNGRFDPVLRTADRQRFPVGMGS